MLETMPISEKLKMLRGRRELTLDELAEQTGLSRSALSNYETNESKEVSQFALVTLAKFYGVSTDYLLGLSALENPMQGDIHDLNISSEMAELLKSGKINKMCIRDRVGGKLTEESMQSSVEAVGELAGCARADGAQKIFIFATSAVRDAANGRIFTERCEAICGAKVEIVSGEEEAVLSYIGASEGGARCV